MARLAGKAGLSLTRRRVTVAAMALTVGCLGAAFTLLRDNEEPLRAQAQAASIDNTEVGPARCPDMWDEHFSPPGGRADLVPTGATEAFLCTYRYDSTVPLRLDASRKITQRVEDLSAYLNGLATDPPQEEMCLLGQTVEHAIVFGFPQQRAVSVRLVDCAWKREGASRYGGDLRKVTGYWGVQWDE